MESYRREPAASYKKEQGTVLRDGGGVRRPARREATAEASPAASPVAAGRGVGVLAAAFASSSVTGRRGFGMADAEDGEGGAEGRAAAVGGAMVFRLERERGERGFISFYFLMSGRRAWQKQAERGAEREGRLAPRANELPLGFAGGGPSFPLSNRRGGIGSHSIPRFSRARTLLGWPGLIKGAQGGGEGPPSPSLTRGGRERQCQNEGTSILRDGGRGGWRAGTVLTTLSLG